MFRLVTPAVRRRMAAATAASTRTAAATMATTCSSTDMHGPTHPTSSCLRRARTARAVTYASVRHQSSGGGGGGGGGGNKDYYKILGISRNADVKEIKKAYRKRALETHPDQGGNKEEFAEVAEAYEVLSSPEKRQLYDQYGSEAATNPNMAGGMGGGFAGRRSAEDIFAEFFRGGFGDMFGGGGMGMSGGMNRGPPTVPPVEVRLRLTLEEVYSGVHKNVRVTRPQVCGECDGNGTKSKQPKPKCMQCNGAGHVVQQQRLGPGMVQQTISECPRCHGTGTAARQEDQCPRCHGNGYRTLTQEVSLDIPAGVPSNVTLVVRGEGGTIPGAQPGDLHVQVEVSPHRIFQRRGDDLIVQKEVTLEEALLGLHMPLKLLDGRVVSVQTEQDAVLKPDGVIRIRGEGLPSTSGGRGDVYVFTRLKMPHKLTAEQRELVQKAFGTPQRDENAETGNIVKARVLRETREQLEEQKRGVWAAQEGMGGRGGGSARDGGGSSARRRQSAGMPPTECATQ